MKVRTGICVESDLLCECDDYCVKNDISRSELKPSDLHPQDFEVQLEQMESPFRQKEVIGFYVYTPPQETTEVNIYG